MEVIVGYCVGASSNAFTDIPQAPNRTTVNIRGT